MMIRKILTPIVIVAMYAGLIPSSSRTIAQTTDARGIGLHQPVSQWPIAAKRWALIIGVDQYQDHQIASLQGADNDAKFLADALVQHAGFPNDQVVVLTTNQPYERQPTRVNILRRLSNLTGVVPKDGLLLVSFAGHGIERHGQAFLLPSDAAMSDDIAFLEDTAISVRRMTDRIAATAVSQVVVLLDACRNDPVGRSDAPNRLTLAFTQFNFDGRNRDVTAFAILYATAVGKRAYEYGEKRQGYFTWAVTNALKGAAADANGQVTLGALIKYVQDTVSKKVSIDMGIGIEQRPFADVRGYRANELIVSIGERFAVTKETDAISHPDSLSVEMTYWTSISASSNPEDFKAYLREYPDGKFASLARNRLSSFDASARLSSPNRADPKGAKGNLAIAENPLLIGRRAVASPYASADDVALGNRLAALTERSSRNIDDPVVTEYVNRVCQNLALHSDSKASFVSKVLDVDEVNVCAFPGYIYITKGAILATDSEAELAALVAHQIAHVVAGHIVAHGQEGLATTGESWSSVPIQFLIFNNEIEREADMYGAQYLWSAGYTPNCWLSFFEKLSKLETRKPGLTSRLFASHPPTEERAQKTRELLSRFPDRDEYTTSTTEFSKVKSRLLAITNGQALDPANRESGPKRPTLKRRKDDEGASQPNSIGEEPKDKPTLKRRDEPPKDKPPEQ